MPQNYTLAIPDGGLVRIASRESRLVPELAFDAVFAEVSCMSWGLLGFKVQIVSAWSSSLRMTSERQCATKHG